MTPCLSRFDSLYRALGNSKLHSQAFRWLFRGSHALHFFIGKLVSEWLPTPSFFSHVFEVVCLGAFKQMFPIKASWVVAGVAGFVSFPDRSSKYFLKDKAMEIYKLSMHFRGWITSRLSSRPDETIHGLNIAQRRWHYNRALSATEVLNLYCQGGGRTP